jgi:hypothetical protein
VDLSLSKEEIRAIIIIVSSILSLIISYFLFLKDNIKRLQEQINIILLRLERIEKQISLFFRPLRLNKTKKATRKNDKAHKKTV